jgi:hypothetical protein
MICSFPRHTPHRASTVCWGVCPRHLHDFPASRTSDTPGAWQARVSDRQYVQAVAVP